MRKIALIVETDPAVRRLIRHTLTRSGVAVRDCETGTAALAFLAAEAGRVGAVVAGELLAGLDGSALVAAVRAEVPDVSVFFFCGGSLDSSMFHAAGVQVFLKPHGLLELCQAVAADLGSGGDDRDSSAAALLSRCPAPGILPPHRLPPASPECGPAVRPLA
jgi:DNA-binding response OmpR family regulator